jgi:hypothetical protein
VATLLEIIPPVFNLPLIAIPPVNAFVMEGRSVELSRTPTILRNKTELTQFYTASERANWSHRRNDGAEEP